MSVWFITGAARGLGSALVKQALAIGDEVVAAARRPDEVAVSADPDRCLRVALDVTSEQQAQEAVASALARFGRIDYLVNNAGASLLGAVEEASAQEVEEVFSTNLFGVLNVTRVVLPIMRAQGFGRIVNIGSMGGFAQSPGWGIYGATKFALEGVTEALAAEVGPLGISATVVELGSFRTEFLGGSLRSTRITIDDYASTVGPVRNASASRNGSQTNDPIKGAAAIIQAVTSGAPPLRLPLGLDAVATVERKVERVRAELEVWRALSESTTFTSSSPNGLSAEVI